jgi:hypothetical protein
MASATKVAKKARKTAKKATKRVKNKVEAAVEQVKAETKQARTKASKAAKKFQTVAPPHVDSNATILSTRKVKKARVIKADEARYRGCTFSGVLELAPDREPVFWRNGDLRAQVDLKWFDWRPERGYLNVAFPEGTYEVVESYTGEVIEAIGR